MTPSTHPAIRVLLVDDHPVLRAGLANLLALEADLIVVGQAGSGEAAVGLWQSCRPDVCLLDLSMPGMGGLETLRRLRSLAPEAAILVLTSSESVTAAQVALEAGASGYLTKAVDHETIVTSIRQVHSGRRGVVAGIPKGCSPATLHVSPRELDVLHLLRKGRSNAEIAAALDIAERTVKFHVTSLMHKLDASDRAGVVARGFDLGILHAEPPEA